MCKRPLYAYTPMRLVEEKHFFWRDHLNIEHVSSTGEYVPDLPQKAIDKHRPYLFCKTFDDWLYLMERYPHYRYKQITCGQCIECRLNYSKEWALRLVCESRFATNCLFLTLTYDDDHLPLNKYGASTLVPQHLKKFNKDLNEYCRYHYGHTGIRYYGVGEYGSETGRSHYHELVFNLPDEVCTANKFFKANFAGDPLFENPILHDIWKRGFLIAGEFNFKTAAYVSRYCLKKFRGKEALNYELADLTPEFSRCSNRPGIGREFYETFKDDFYVDDKIYLPGIPGLNPPHYFDRLYDIEEPCQMAINKQLRTDSALRRNAEKMSDTDRSYTQILEDEERKLKKTIDEKLFRGL